MKKLFAIILIALMVGCTEKGDIEVVQLDENYKDIAKIKGHTSKIVSDSLAKSIYDTLMVIVNNSSIEDDHFRFESVLLINKSGSVDKLIILNAGNQKFIKQLTESLDKWKFGVVTENENAINYKITWFLIFNRNSDGKFSLSHSSINLPIEKNGEIFYMKAEVMPEPIGGIRAIQEKVRYPALAKKAGIQGRVFLKAFIDTEGNVVKTELIKGIGGGCNEAAAEAIMATKFLPGRIDGKPVNVEVTVPILFKLK